MRRFVGVTAHREFARHLIHRLPLVGVPRSVLDTARRRVQGGRMGLAAEQQSAYFTAQDFYAYQAVAAYGGGRQGA